MLQFKNGKNVRVNYICNIIDSKENIEFLFNPDNRKITMIHFI